MPINRLFWKFFIYLWLAQFATMSGLNAYFWYRYAQMNSAYQAQQLANAVEGDSPLPHNTIQPQETAQIHAHLADARQQAEAPRKPRSIFPIRPLIAGTLASAVFAGLLAWSFSRPITQLRHALNLAANGNLDVRIGDSMKKRNDELGDLGVEFDRMSSQLQQLLSSQQNLLHDVSHEMRSPLARMQAIIGLIDQKPEQRAELLEKLSRESQRIDKLVSELLTVARLDTGLLQPAQHLISAEELLVTLVDDAQPQAEIAGITLLTNFELLQEQHIHGDGDMLYRAIDNLLRNALKFTPEGGTVRITATCTRTQLGIEIVDNGPGISSQELEQIRMPFYRSHHAKPISGHGLGLAIADKIINAHKGNLLLKQRTDGDTGLHVVIQLPLSQQLDNVA